MDKAVIGGITLDYEVSGAEDPVVFIHGAFIADAFKPLVDQAKAGTPGLGIKKAPGVRGLLVVTAQVLTRIL